MLTVRFKPDGRVLVPVELRRALGASPGEPLVARVQDRQLVIERRVDALRRIQGRFAHVPAGVSLADELIDDRRREAAAETAHEST
ncbi:MAG: AbrB family transcriptional regulator [Chloroflexi bacterium]|nr:AbrB family transcriptional regulator [Chloroflexota bacterium]